MKEFLVRLAVGVVMVAVVVVVMRAGGWWVVGGITLLGVVLVWEWRGLVGGGGQWSPLAVCVHVLGMVGGVLTGYAQGVVEGLTVVLLALGAGGIVQAMKQQKPWALAGYVWLCVPMVLLASMWREGWQPLVWVLAVVAGCDVGAYVVGRLVGGAKLLPRVSPGKTWSGLAGGVLVGSTVGGVLVSAWQESVWGYVLGAVASVAAQAADLAQSALKRRVGVKDSGVIFPGHGGMFDRLDGLLGVVLVGGWVVVL